MILWIKIESHKHDDSRQDDQDLWLNRADISTHSHSTVLRCDFAAILKKKARWRSDTVIGSHWTCLSLFPGMLYDIASSVPGFPLPSGELT